MSTRRSIILVTVDCLRADRVGPGGDQRRVTPFLNSLGASGAIFSRAMVAGAPTYFSFPAIMASRYPLALGREALGIAPGEATLASALQDAGHKTAAFLAGNPYLSARYGYDRGFDRFEDFLKAAAPAAAPPSRASRFSILNRRLQAASRSTSFTAAIYEELYFWYCQWQSEREEVSFDSLRRYPAANVVVDEASAWLNSIAGAPCFLWIHLMDPHHPYYPPAEALAALGLEHVTATRARFLNSFWNRGDVGIDRLQKYKAEIISLYDAGVYWVDRQIARLAEFLQRLGRWDDTVFAVTADHGEEFLERDQRYHSPTGLPDKLIHVPLLLRAPGLEPAQIDSVFSMIHLAPTLLRAAGVPAPSDFAGNSCWESILSGATKSEPANVDVAISECIEEREGPAAGTLANPRLLAVRERDAKLVIRFSTQTDDLYDLKKDPGERSPLPRQELRAERARLLRVARTHLQNERQKRNSQLAVRARLRDLKRSLRARETVGSPSALR